MLYKRVRIMKLIDFDRKFHEYTEKWFRENRNRYRKIEDMEAYMPELYLRWLNTPVDWADGLSPSEYVSRFDDVDMLIDWMLQYLCSKIPLPDLLLERITDLHNSGKGIEKKLINILNEKGLENYKGLDINAAKQIAINLLNEIQSTEPMELYISLIAKRDKKDEIADNAAESLINMGRIIVEPVLKALEHTNNLHARECFVDILSNFSNDDRIFRWILTMFEETEEKKALYASYLGKYGDDRAIQVLEKAIKSVNINYLDYIEIKNAIEELGGVIEIDRDFSGDKYYEALKNLE